MQVPAPARIIEESIMGPSLGSEVIHSSIIAFIVVLYCYLYDCFLYGTGDSASIALIINMLIIFGVYIFSAYFDSICIAGIFYLLYGVSLPMYYQ